MQLKQYSYNLCKKNVSGIIIKKGGEEVNIQKPEDLMKKFKERGFYYSKDLIFNYYNCLITKPFVILTGISGSGKSKIAEIFAELMSFQDEKQHELIPVKPNWRDNKGLFGFHNLIDDSYYITPLVGMFIRALKNPEKPYFLILDEMNIAKTEHYFADYLSLIESRRIEEKIVTKPVPSSIGDLKKIFQFKTGKSLSEAIILAALDINKPGIELDIREYRENVFSLLWKEQFFGGKEENWTPQFRSELNQGPGRLANRVFEGGNGKYKLKDKAALSPGDLAIIEDLERTYQNIEQTVNKEIIQDNMVLHNNSVCLGTGSNAKCSYTNCPYKNNEKYKCDHLYDPTTETYLIPPEIPIPLNVFTIGTVNVDETTYMFSPKVLDRSNVIEFNEVDFSELYMLTDSMKNILKDNNMIFKNEEFFFESGKDLPELRICIPEKQDVDSFLTNNKDEYEDLLKVFVALQKYNMHFGYRVMNEIGAYMRNVYKHTPCAEKGVIGLDLQLLQKVLPKFYGAYDKLWGPLTEILGICLKSPKVWSSNMDINILAKEIANILEIKELVGLDLNKEQIEQIFKYPRTASKILMMLNDLNSVGFATFIK